MGRNVGKSKLTYQDFRPLRKGEAGYSPTARKYLSPSTGEVIPLRKFQTLAHKGESFEKRRKRATVLHGVTPRTYRSTRGTSYKDFITEYQKTQNPILLTQGLKPLSREDVRRDPDFKEAYAAIVRSGKVKNVDRSADGPLARALVKMGRRQKEWRFPVGES